MNKALARAALDEANIETLKGAINTQNAQLDALSQADATKLAAAEHLVANSQTKAAGLQATVNELLDAPLPKGASCARMEFADARILGDLK